MNCDNCFSWLVMGGGASSASKYQTDLSTKEAEIRSLQRRLAASESAKPVAAATKADAADANRGASIPLTHVINGPGTDAPEWNRGAAGGSRQRFAEETADAKSSRERIMACLRLRQKYLREPVVSRRSAIDKGSALCMVMVDGVAEIEGLNLPSIPSREEFRIDLIELWRLVKDPPCKTLAMSRLDRLSTSFQSYLLDYASYESDAVVELSEDFYSVMKVDNHIHLAAAMTPVMFLKFIRHKLRDEPERIVSKGKSLKAFIQEALQKLPQPPGVDIMNLGTDDLGDLIRADSLRMCAGDHFYHRFDVFNGAYSPLGSDALRTVFMKSTNEIGGQYFGELTQEIIKSFEEHQTYSEMRLSIYGRKPSEWDDLAQWMKKHSLHKPPYTQRNMWLVQIPRVYKAFFMNKFVQNFEEFLNNIFQALYEVALDPCSHPDLADVLPSITGFDCVDDESIADPLLARRSQVYGEQTTTESVAEALRPQRWNVAENPPYSYYCYFLYANLRRFNDVCQIMGRPWHLSFRPHAGEAGEVHHLATSFLVANSINHGINLWHSPVLQYLYYLTQMGISVSPMSNNSLFLKIKDNPFPYFFRRGLNATLSTDDPLMFHSTNQPLLEEYTAARLVFGLSAVDLCEIAANSVRQSGFPLDKQAEALGEGVQKPDCPYAWTPGLCNVPELRLRYRRQVLANELAFMQHGRRTRVDSRDLEAGIS